MGFHDQIKNDGIVFVDKVRFATFTRDCDGELSVYVYARVLIGNENNKAPVEHNVKNIVRRYLINEHERNFEPTEYKCHETF